MSEKTVQELLKELHKLDELSETKIRKLECDESGTLFLDRNNESDLEWYYNDQAYDVI